jgi:hypothetical protein
MAIDWFHRQKTGKLNHVSFDKIVKLSCRNHGYLVKHTLKECDLIKLYFKGDYKATGMDVLSRSTVSFDKRVKLSCYNHGYLVKHTLEECDLIKLYFNGSYKATGTDVPSRSTVSFDKIVKLSCRNHNYLVKHTHEECDLIKHYFKGNYKATGTDAPSRSTSNEEKGDVYPDSKGCLMIFGGPVLYESKHWQKLMTREVNAAVLGEAMPAFLKWSKTMITFNRKDHPDHIPQPGCFLLVVDMIINKTHLSCVLMYGRSNLNLLYAETHEW